MRADTTHTITFDFVFQYPRQGSFDESSSITVCEPNYDKRHVYRRMQGYFAQAQNAILKNLNADEIKAAAELAAALPTTPEVKGEQAEPKIVDALRTMRMGLSLDDYCRFCDYVQKELTNCKQLAYVGADPEDKQPISDVVWMNLAKEGGVEAVETVLSEFTSFSSVELRGNPRRAI